MSALIEASVTRPSKKHHNDRNISVPVHLRTIKSVFMSGTANDSDPKTIADAQPVHEVSRRLGLLFMH